MKNLFVFIFLIFNLFAYNLDKLRVEHNLVLDEKGLYTGRVYKGNMSSNVVLGVITDFSIYIDKKEVFNVNVKNNRFHGEGTMNHDKLGKLKLFYDNSYLIEVEGSNFTEIWNDNLFFEGIENNIKYNYISKNPYLEFFDKYSFNVIQNFFELKNINTGFILTNTGLHIFDNKTKMKKYFYEDSLEISLSLKDENYYFISILDMDEGKLYQGKIINNTLDSITYSDTNGAILVEEYKYNLFFRGKNFRNASTYSESQLKFINKIFETIIKNRLTHLKT